MKNILLLLCELLDGSLVTTQKINENLRERERERESEETSQ
jgi:hypothetical protein